MHRKKRRRDNDTASTRTTAGFSTSSSATREQCGPRSREIRLRRGRGSRFSEEEKEEEDPMPQRLHTRTRPGGWRVSLLLCLVALLACSWDLVASAAAPKTCAAGGTCSAEAGAGVEEGGELPNSDPPAEPLSPPDPEAVAVVERLLQWAEDNFNMTGLRGPDAAFSVVISGDTTQVRNPDEPKKKARPSYGLAARREFKRGEMVLNFPPEMLIRADRLLNKSRDPAETDHPPLFNATTQQQEEDDDLGWGQFVAVAAFILREKAKGEASFWAPFLAVLPEHVALPVYWSEEFVGALEYEPAEGVVLGYKEAFKTNWEKINPEAVANASQAEFYWALSLACSRLFDASKPSESETALYVDPAGDEEGDLLPPGTEEDEEALGGGGTVLGMLPVADFLNHATSYSVEWIVDHREGKGKRLLKMGQSKMPALQRTISLRFSSIEDITPGSELTTTYGTQNNDHLLLSYSFVLSPNVFDDFLVASGPDQVLDFFLQVQKRRDERRSEAEGEDDADPLELERPLLQDFPASPFWNDSGLSPEQVIISSNRAVQEVKPTYVEWEVPSEPKYDAVEVVEASEDRADDEDAQPRYALWGYGDLDPRLLVAFAALRYVELYSQEPPYGALALAAIPFAWDLMEADCHSYSQNMTHEELRVLQEAAADLKLGIQILSEGFSTTAEQDRLALFELRECQKRQFRNESGGQLVVAGGMEVDCSDNLEKHQREWEMILLFRMGKKGIIRDARQRLEDRCIHPTSQLADWTSEDAEGDPEEDPEEGNDEADLQEA